MPLNMQTLNEVLSGAYKEVVSRTPKMKGGLLGTVKAEAANSEIEKTAHEAVKQAGADIMAAYNKVVVKNINSSTKVRTTTGFNEVTHEVIAVNPQDAKEVVTRYSRTTPRGNYVVETSPETGQRTLTRYTAPNGIVRETAYETGHPVRNVDRLLAKEQKWEAGKGRPIRTSNSEYNKSTYVEYADGSGQGFSFAAGEAKPAKGWIDLDKKTTVYKDYKENVTDFYIKGTEGRAASDGIFSHAYHKNPETGAITKTKLVKDFDEFGRDVRKVVYEFPEGSKMQNAELVYTKSPNPEPYRGKFFDLSHGSFTFGDKKASFDGKEIKANFDYIKDISGNSNGEAEIFEEVFRNNLAKADVSSELFLPKYSQGLWQNM